ncbi:MAG: type II restriction endonuclease [Bacilli bacterium]|nr:type II restriction endonuclease [Bacilli bacterium]
MNRNFMEWLSTFKDSIADWKYYTDFEKAYLNVDNIKIELNILNSLIGSKDIHNEFKALIARYPEVLKSIPILLAKRESEIKITDLEGHRIFNFLNPNYSLDEYILFMDRTGLFDLLTNHIISDLIDYVIGVEVGLDTNARKNRTGTQMENLVEKHLLKLGFVNGESYFTQMTTKSIRNKFGVNVTSLNNEDTADKRFDFVVKTSSMVYGIEVNFYSGGGSKLNETARSYKLIAQESKHINGFQFIWITDGTGWKSAKNNLEETFLVLDTLFNINDLELGLLSNILK